MLEFLKLLVPLFLAPKTYYDVRQKLGAFVVYEVWIASYLLMQVGSASSFFARTNIFIVPDFLEKSAPWLVTINPFGLICGLVMGLAFFMFHLHDRVSDVFKIRSRFDRNHIIIPLAHSAGVTLDFDQLKRIEKSQDRLMRNVFYKYTSSTAERVLVDRHDIEQALESWSWFWVSVEGLIVWIVGLSISIAFLDVDIALIFGLLSILYLGVMWAIWPFLKRRARVQVEAIADDPTASVEIKKIFHAI